MHVSVEGLLKQEIVSIPNFPIPGIDFKDITPLLAQGDKFALAIEELRRPLMDLDFSAIVAVESRGFIIGAALASHMQRGIILVRKPGKLPGAIDSFGYSCEYCSGTLQVRCGSIRPDHRYLVVDDLLATGGTARATADYIAQAQGHVAGFCFLVELSFLGGRQLLQEAPVITLINY